MKILPLLATTLTLTLSTFADVQEEWTKATQELTKVSKELSAKERELRTAGEGSTALEEKAREAFAKFLQAMDENTELAPYTQKQRALEAELETALQANDDQKRESALFELQKLKGEQMSAALQIPKLLQLKLSADEANLKAQEALVKSDPEARALFKKRQKLLDHLTKLSSKLNTK